MIDYHCHLLPDIDDGPTTIEESLRMSSLLAEAGYRNVFCTPHFIKDMYDADHETVRLSIKRLQKEIDCENIPLHLLGGREYCLDDHFHEFLNNLMPLEGTRYLLIEIPSDTYPELVRDSLSAILRNGLIPMIAHPERCRMLNEQQEERTFYERRFFWRKNSYSHLSPEPTAKSALLLDWLIQKRCAFQINLGSFIGAYGIEVQTAALQLRDRNICTHFGTDAHSSENLEYLFKPIKNIR